MIRIALALCFLSLTLFGCKNRKTQNLTMDDKIERNEEGGWDESLGVQTLKGTPYGTKGAQVMLRGVILNDREVLKREGLYPFNSSKWQGVTLVVRGEVIRYHCGPYEQCLSQGYIDGIRKIESITISGD